MTRLWQLAIRDVGVWFMTCLVVTVTLLVLSFAPTMGYAEGQGNCKRTDEGICDVNGPRTCTDDNGDKGRCLTRGYACNCVTSKDEAQENYINIMYDSANAALAFEQVRSTLGASVACSQLGPLVSNLLTAKDLLVDLGPVGFGEAKHVQRLEFVILALPTLASFGSTCGLTIPVSDATSVLLTIKLALLSHLFDGLSTVP